MSRRRRADALDLPQHNYKLTSFTAVQPINQKNFYTAYLKSDNQVFSNRQVQENVKREALALQRKAIAAQERDNTPADAANDDDDEDAEADEQEKEPAGSKTIVLHLGSRNMRIGLASELNPRTIPLVVARRDEAKRQARPLVPLGSSCAPGMFGEDFEEQWHTLEQTMKARMRQAKRRQVPQASEMAANFNNRTQPEEITDHNDSGRIEWTDVAGAPAYIIGTPALRIPPDSQPHYTYYWPIRYGLLNEKAYASEYQALGDLRLIVEHALTQELKTEQKSLSEYAMGIIIPDLYDRAFVERFTNMLMREFNLTQVAILQESTCAVYGAGISSACVVDVGAQKTSVTCVEDGICIGDSRILLAQGGDDMTLLNTKLLLRIGFPYRDFDLSRNFDLAFMDELKLKFCTTNEADTAIQLYNCLQRQPGRLTRKYEFKVYDEPILTTMAVCQPAIFDSADKYDGRRSLLPPSTDIYDDSINEPESVIQDRLLYGKCDREPNPLLAPPGGRPIAPKPAAATPVVQAADDAPASDGPTPMELDPPGTMVPAEPGIANGEIPPPAPDEQAPPSPETGATRALTFPLDQAIVASIECACENVPNAADRRKALYGTILFTGAGYNFPHAGTYMEERLRALRPDWQSLAIIPAPRNIDPAVLAWKGMSIFCRCKVAHEFWITSKEYDMLGLRGLQAKSQGFFWNG